MILISSWTITLRGRQRKYYSYLIVIRDTDDLGARKGAGQGCVEMGTWTLSVTKLGHSLGGQQFGDVYEKSYVFESWPQSSPSWGHPQEMILSSEKAGWTRRCPLK